MIGAFPRHSFNCEYDYECEYLNSNRKLKAYMEKQIANAKIVKDKCTKASAHRTSHISLFACVCKCACGNIRN